MKIIFKSISSKFPISTLLLVMLALTNYRCSSKVGIEGIDFEIWKNDRNGCLGLRANDLEKFREVKNEFLGKNNQALIKTFGRPDKVELADRSQTFFIYFIDPSPSCEGQSIEEEPLKAIFRLNAISRVSEITISKLDP
ncbi:hypothetical protein [Cecembia sp.]|uniref:hypothetical protein n=1 Tax=Cecembia sp. TaxID=1898110 RepID=UPI0025C5AA4D|nr:hypothetical protein [Cecembia sp.]